MVAVQYTMCCVQCVLGFGKSDRGGVAPVGGEVRTLVNRRHRCRRERERGTVTTGEHAHCALELSPDRFDGQHMTRTRVTLSFSRRVREVSMTFHLNPSQMCFVISATWLGQFYRYFRGAICIYGLLST